MQLWRIEPRSLMLAAALFVVLVVIAVFIDDDFVRPYGGDIIVVIFLYAALRGVTRLGPWISAASVFVFAASIEAAQAAELIYWLGLENNRIARTVIGSTADAMDVVAYGVGALIALAGDDRIGAFRGMRRRLRRRHDANKQ